MAIAAAPLPAGNVIITVPIMVSTTSTRPAWPVGDKPMYPVILSGPIATAVVPVPAGMKLISINIMLSRMETVAASPQHDVRKTFWLANEIEGARRKSRVARVNGIIGFRKALRIKSPPEKPQHFIPGMIGVSELI